jgi:hypothetical protein
LLFDWLGVGVALGLLVLEDGWVQFGKSLFCVQVVLSLLLKSSLLDESLSLPSSSDLLGVQSGLLEVLYHKVVLSSSVLMLDLFYHQNGFLNFTVSMLLESFFDLFEFWFLYSILFLPLLLSSLKLSSDFFLCLLLLLCLLLKPLLQLAWHVVKVELCL